MRTRSFTLIELLVVVAIIAVLVAVLLPALSAARGMTRQVACLSQTRQFGQVLLMYAADNADHFPSARWHNGGQTGSANTWYSNMTPWLDPAKTWTQVWLLNYSEQIRYNEMWETLLCPAEDVTTIPYRNQGVHPTYGHNMSNGAPYYAGEGLTNWGGSGETRRLTEVDDPSTTMAFMDTKNVDYIYPTFYQWCVSPEGQASGGLDRYMPVRHPSGYTGTFVDGHGRTIAESEAADPNSTMWIAQRP